MSALLVMKSINALEIESSGSVSQWRVTSAQACDESMTCPVASSGRIPQWFLSAWRVGDASMASDESMACDESPTRHALRDNCGTRHALNPLLGTRWGSTLELAIGANSPDPLGDERVPAASKFSCPILPTASALAHGSPRATTESHCHSTTATPRDTTSPHLLLIFGFLTLRRPEGPSAVARTCRNESLVSAMTSPSAWQVQLYEESDRSV